LLAPNEYILNPMIPIKVGKLDFGLNFLALAGPQLTQNLPGINPLPDRKFDLLLILIQASFNTKITRGASIYGTELCLGITGQVKKRLKLRTNTPFRKLNGQTE